MYTHIVSLFQVSYQQTAGWEPLFFFLPIWLPSLHSSCQESYPLCDCGWLCQFNCIILSNAWMEREGMICLLQMICLLGLPVAREQSFATLFLDHILVLLLLSWPAAMIPGQQFIARDPDERLRPAFCKTMMTKVEIIRRRWDGTDDVEMDTSAWTRKWSGSRSLQFF